MVREHFPETQLRASGIARRRTEESEQRRSSAASDDDGGGFGSAMRDHF